MLVAFVFVINAAAQDRVITGKIVDDKGSPVAGVSVTSSDGKGTQTDADGNYSITTTKNTRTLTFSSVDFETQNFPIRGGTTINVALASKNNVLEDVVVVGYQSVKRKEIIGSVSTVGGKEIAQKPIANFTQLLQGKAPGLQITGEGGRPGANAFIRIRGTGSINASSEPLIILDGVQITTASYSAINPNDIEDIAVLKDAASAAVYGSRAANGVLVITSKRGKGKPELRYSFQYGRSRVLRYNNIRLMNSQEKLQYEFDANFANQNLRNLITQKITGGTLPAGATVFSVDATTRQNLWNELAAGGAGNWTDVYFQDATSKTHEVSLTGQSDKIRYFLSLNRNDNEGTVFGSFFNRTGARLNVEYQAKDWIKIGTNLSVTRSKEALVRELNNNQNAVRALFTTNPYEPVLNPNGTYNLTINGFSPLESAINNPSMLDRLAGFVSMFAEAKVNKNITLKSLIGINYNTLLQETYLKPGSNLANILGFNQKTDAYTRSAPFVFTNTATYKASLGKRNNFNVLLGQEFNKSRAYSLQAVNRNFPSATFTTLNNATPFSGTSSRADFALISYFASAGYDYDKKYFLTLSGRRDGSSRFGRDSRFANFGAAGFAWDVKKEGFMNNVNFVNNLRLKLAVGTSGNNNIGNYSSLGTYSFSSRYGDVPAATPAQLENAGLTWETNTTYDAGIEFGVLKSRITGSVGYFKRKTGDLLFRIPVSQTSGFSDYLGNVGAVENKGIELELTGNIIRKKDLNWSVSVNYTNVDNKITNLRTDNIDVLFGKLKIGQPINTFFLVKNAGINPANGKQQWFKADGKTITETFQGTDAVLLDGKSPNVKFFGSVNTNFNYKAFDLSVQLYYSGGNYIYNQVYASNTGASSIGDIKLASAANYWKKPGDITEFANVADVSQRIVQTSDKFLEKGDYISLRDLTIGYTMTSDIAQKIKLSGIRFFVQGTNLFIGTKFRGMPEVGQSQRERPDDFPGSLTLYAYPQARAITVGIDVKF